MTVVARIFHDWPIKAAGTTAGMSLFFVAYFALLQHPLSPPVEVPLTVFDEWVAFSAYAIVPYCLLWPYVALLPALLIERRELLGFASSTIGLALAGLGCFWLWPTLVPVADIDWTKHPATAFLKSADASGNACPSLHAAFAVFVGLWFARLLPRLGAGLAWQVSNVGLALGIVWSTLATQQHVALDVICGSLLGAWAAGLSFVATPPGEGAPVQRRSLFLAVGTIKVCAVLLICTGAPVSFGLAVFLSGGAFVLHSLFAPQGGELVRVCSDFAPSHPNAREVWLTVDDGPDPEDTPRILDLLDQHQARATFFLIGERAARHPELVAEIVRRGHETGHHTHTHPLAWFWAFSSKNVARELDLGLGAIRGAWPAGAAFPSVTRFRAPAGIKNLWLGPALRTRHLTCIGWSIRSGDTWASDPAAVARGVVARLRPGAIILMHEGPPLKPAVRVTAFAHVLAGLASHSYRAVIPPVQNDA